jgi:hypothetical protein
VLHELRDCLRSKEQHEQQSTQQGGRPIALTDNNIEEVILLLQDHYHKGSRQTLVVGLSGLLLKDGIELESAERLIIRLASNDGEKKERIAALYAT